MDNGKKNEMSRSDQDDLRIDMYSKMVANLRDIPQDIEGSYMVGHALLHLKDSVISRLYYDRDNPPTAERVQEIKNTVDEAMDAGRKGIGDAAVNGEYAFAFNDISAQINKELAHAVHSNLNKCCEKLASLRNIPMDTDNSLFVSKVFWDVAKEAESLMSMDNTDAKKIREMVVKAMDTGLNGAGEDWVNLYEGKRRYILDVIDTPKESTSARLEKLAAAQQSDKAQQSNFQSQQTYISGPSQG